MPDPDLPIRDVPRPGEPEPGYVPPGEADRRDQVAWREVGWILLTMAAFLLWAWDELREWWR